MPVLDRASREMTRNEEGRYATKVPSWVLNLGALLFYGWPLNPKATGATPKTCNLLSVKPNNLCVTLEVTYYNSSSAYLYTK